MCLDPGSSASSGVWPRLPRTAATWDGPRLIHSQLGTHALTRLSARCSRGLGLADNRIGDGYILVELMKYMPTMMDGNDDEFMEPFVTLVSKYTSRAHRCQAPVHDVDDMAGKE